MNILILSVGTRCQLVKYFKDRNNGFKRVIVTDCSRYAPALYIADKYYISPRIDDSDYLEYINEICLSEKIDVILPLNEMELEVVSDHCKFFERNGHMVAVSDSDTIRLCKDKYLLYKYLNKNKIPCVETYSTEDIFSSDNIQFPIMIKERCGAGSVGMIKCYNRELLNGYINNSDIECIVQPYISGKEYGVDLYIDYISGEIVDIFIKEKIRMRAGETEKSKAIKNEKILKLIEKLTKVIRFKGAIDIDILEDNGEYFILEINPRFGGGYPHAYECGVNFIKYLSNNAAKLVNNPESGNYMEGKILLKYTESMLLDEKDML